MDAENYQLCLTELKLQDMDAVNLLETLMDQRPHVARLAIVNPEFPDLMLRCTRLVHQFIPQDCKADELQNIFAQVLKLQDMMMSEALLKIVSRIDVLPSIPVVYDEIMRELSNPSASAQSLAAIIEKDISMTTQILKFVNSAFFGVFNKVRTPVQAITLLGIDTVKTLALSYEIFSMFKTPSDVKFSPERVWKHSLRTAQYARAITVSMSSDIQVQNDAYMAGFLHDIGKLVLVSKLPNVYIETQRIMEIMKINQAQAEITQINITHAEIGAYLLGLWGFSDIITQSVALHHDPDQFKSRTFVPSMAVYAANMIEAQIAAGNNRLKTEHHDFFRIPYLHEHITEWFQICLNLELAAESRE
jgi:HD-like signal output (HDOD) protein